MSTDTATRTVVLEIGTEEIPAGMLGPALKQLRELAADRLAEARLGTNYTYALGTPRRMVLFAEGVEPRQEELREWVRGPSRKVAFGEDGSPTRAAEGFAGGQGAAVSDLVVRDTEGGEYVFAQRIDEGRKAPEVLAGLLPELIAALEFPKTMRWGDHDFRFVRPIRWIVALYGERVVFFEVAGVRSDRVTYGHRTLAPDPITVPSAGELGSLLERAYVILDPAERARRITEQAARLVAGKGAKVALDPGLLEEVTNLVEWPTAFLGGFSEDYLNLPREVLVTTMRVHQRYFPVEDPDGRLLPMFVGVRNGDDRHLATVGRGNEKVLAARLADARFFFDEDKERPLEDYVDRLRTVVFQEELGTYYDKTERVRRLCGQLALALKLDVTDAANLDRAAQLMKADQVTAMVQELPELEGVMGREYARFSGEPEAVAEAIYEHHLPRGSSDELPRTVAGTILSLADKLDTVTGCFAVGIKPSGSQDPYGLRRAALASLRLLHASRLDVSLGWCIDAALDGHAVVESASERRRVASLVLDFFKRRFDGLLKDAGYRYDVVAAVLNAGFDMVADTWRRAGELQEFLSEDALDDVITAYTRAHNLAQSAGSEEVRETLLHEQSEIALYRAVRELLPATRKLAATGQYAALLRRSAKLRAPVDDFLDNLMVMVDDQAIRENRLALLKQVDQVFSPYFDLSSLEL